MTLHKGRLHAVILCHIEDRGYLSRMILNQITLQVVTQGLDDMCVLGCDNSQA